MADFEGVHQVVGGAPPVDLDQIGPGGVAKATGPLRVQSNRAFCPFDGVQRARPGRGRIHELNAVLWRTKKGGGLPVGHRSPAGRKGVTPSDCGGSPASMQTNSDHASTWRARGPVPGDHEARISISVPT